MCNSHIAFFQYASVSLYKDERDIHDYEIIEYDIYTQALSYFISSPEHYRLYLLLADFDEKTNLSKEDAIVFFSTVLPMYGAIKVRFKKMSSYNAHRLYARVCYKKLNKVMGMKDVCRFVSSRVEKFSNNSLRSF